MPFVKGQSGNPSGLPKGYRHESTKIKESFLKAFEKSGGLKALVEWISEKDSNRREFYKMVIQLLPKELEMSGAGGNGEIVIRVIEQQPGADVRSSRFAIPSLQ